MACVLNNLPIDNEEIREWIDWNCEGIMDIATQINKGVIFINQHHSPEGVDVVGGLKGHGFMYTAETDQLGGQNNGSMLNSVIGRGTALYAGLPAEIDIKDQSSMALSFEQALGKVTYDDKSIRFSSAIKKALGSSTEAGDLQQIKNAYGTGIVTGATRDQIEESFKHYRRELETLRTNLKKLESLAEEYRKLIEDQGLAWISEKDKIEAAILDCRENIIGSLSGWGSKTRAECITPEQEAELKALKAKIDTATEAVGEVAAGLGQAIAGSQEPTKRTFKEQCLLLSNIVHFVEYRNTNIYPDEKKRLPYMEHMPEGAAIPGANDASIPASPPINANACLMAERQPWGFMNQLVQDPSYAELFGIRGHLLSQLQPMIKLYKVVSYSDGKEIETEVNFDSVYNPGTAHNPIDGIFKSTKKRGFGVGIQNFVFSYEGSDPFAVKKSIKAKLSIFASSMDDLLVDRGGYRYADLALKTGTKTHRKGVQKSCADRSEINSDILSKENFRLKAVVGWAIPANFKGSTDTEAQTIYDAINNSYVTLNLTPTIHEFDINELGNVVFHINYLAYIEEFFDETSFNIFTDFETQKTAFSRKHAYKALMASCGDVEGSQEALKKRQEEDAEDIDNEKRAQLKSFLKKLLEREKIYFKGIPFEALRAFNSQGPYWKFDLLTPQPGPDGQVVALPIKTAEAAQVEGGTTDAIKANPKPDKEAKGGEDLKKAKVSDINMKEYITFFYLSDLVDVILENIDETLRLWKQEVASMPTPTEIKAGAWQEIIAAETERVGRVYFNFRKFRCLLGPIELIDTKTKEYYETTIGDLPISTAYFMDWLADKTLKRDSSIYSLPIFLKDLMNNLVKNFLNEDRCFDLNIKQRVRVFQSTVTSYKNPNWGIATGKNIDEITEWIVQQGKPPRLDMHALAQETTRGGRSTAPVLHVMGERKLPINKRGPENTYNYMVFYAGRVQPQILMNGDSIEDQKAGIFHYVLGRDRGLIKNIQLTKTDSPGLKEVRFEQEGYDGLMQLREVYDANITCYGSPNIVPGTYIYVDPRGFAPNTSAFVGNADADGNPIDNASLTRLGIGGYYMVIRAENKFGPAQCETELTAKWVAQLACESSKAKSSGPQKRRPAKCNT